MTEIGEVLAFGSDEAAKRLDLLVAEFETSGLGGVNFVRSTIWHWVHCSVGSEGAGWKPRDKSKEYSLHRSRHDGHQEIAARSVGNARMQATLNIP
jgi:hypothetical protein